MIMINNGVAYVEATATETVASGKKNQKTFIIYFVYLISTGSYILATKRL